MTIIKKIWKWFLSSNRYKHFVGGVVVGVGADTDYCAAYSGILVASSLEYKDREWGGKWDWIDFGCTLAGVFVGRLIRMILLRL